MNLSCYPLEAGGLPICLQDLGLQSTQIVPLMYSGDGKPQGFLTRVLPHEDHVPTPKSPLFFLHGEQHSGGLLMLWKGLAGFPDTSPPARIPVYGELGGESQSVTVHLTQVGVAGTSQQRQGTRWQWGSAVHYESGILAHAL